MNKIRVLVNGDWHIVEANSPSLDMDLPTEIQQDLVCDFCKRPYTEWVPDEPGKESPLDICGKDDCESVAMSLPVNQNIYDM